MFWGRYLSTKKKKKMSFVADHWAFVIVGMRFAEENFGEGHVTAKMVEDCVHLGLFRQPDNPHDPNAILVKGLMTDGTFKPVGFISKTSLPRKGDGVPEIGTDGTVFEVYDSWAHGPDSAAVHVRVNLKSAVEFNKFHQE